MTHKRKVPFSNKMKKQQLQARKAKDRGGPEGGTHKRAVDISELPTSSSKRSDRYVLKFKKESNEEIERRKQIASEQLASIQEKSLEMSEEDLFPEGLSFPIRPPWSYEMSPQELDMRENRYFLKFMNELETTFGDSLSHYEENLETWRQLWRVLEMSDVLLCVVDIRFPNLLFPPMIYNYIMESKKEIILVLNKIDLIPPSVVAAWLHHFKVKYPQLHMVLFTSFPTYNMYGSQTNKAGLQKRRRRGKLRMSAEGAQQLYEVCQKIVGDEVDLSSWKHKITEEANKEFDDVEIEETISKCKSDTTFYNHEKYKNGVLTIGCVGQPNVGKSSVINALMGNKVVSVSKTPGHTKHFQTIFLTNTVRLCDCPGLVFPSKVPKVAQVLMGSYPIAQLREPYTTIKFLAERVDIVKLLNIKHPSDDEEWSAMDVCEAWAIKSGFYTAKAARPDTYRAANSILRMVLDGTIPFSFVPPNYFNEKENWEKSSELEQIKCILASDKSVPEMMDTTEEGDHSQSESGSEDQEESEKETLVQNKFSLLNDDSD